MSDDNAGLVRRVEKLEDAIGEHQQLTHDMDRDTIVKLVKLDTQMEHLINTLKTFVNHSQFEPVRLIAYGLAAGVLTTVLGAVMMKLGGFIK